MKRAFTLLEMIVVVGIIGVLSAIMLVVMSGSTESARAAKCLANLKSLANAVQSAAGASGGYNTTAQYPRAGSSQTHSVDTSQGIKNVQMKYGEMKGWVSWWSKGKYPSTSASSCELIGMYTRDTEQAQFALTNGALWKYVSANASVYVCPTHARKKSPVHWSYLMNAYFGWDACAGFSYGPNRGFIYYGTIEADRYLLFAEVPFQGAGEWFPSGEGGSTDTDGVLQYNGCNESPAVAGSSKQNGNENIGANHTMGNQWVAHVAFADGHVERLKVGKKGAWLGAQELQELTTWLCTGVDVAYSGGRYEELK